MGIINNELTQRLIHTYSGIYIMQNTMVRAKGGGKKMKKGKENRRKIILKKKEKVLKMHLFGI